MYAKMFRLLTTASGSMVCIKKAKLIRRVIHQEVTVKQDPHGGLPATIAEIQRLEHGAQIVAHGWIRNVRRQKSQTFVELVDGTSLNPLQIVVPACEDTKGRLLRGCSLQVTGELRSLPKPTLSTRCELLVAPNGLKVCGPAHPDYPIDKNRHDVGYMRTTNVLLRPRTRDFTRILLVRDCVTRALRCYLHENGFLEIHTPLLTSTDCEGAGATFNVHASAVKSNTDETPRSGFFGASSRPVSLSVSAQLHLEIFANAHPRVFTLSPCFRAERSRSPRHLAEFYMLEVELANITSLDSLIHLAQNLLRCAAKEIEKSKLLETGDPALDAAARERLNFLQADAASSAKPTVLTATNAAKLLAKNSDRCNYTIGAELSPLDERELPVQLGKPTFVTHFNASTRPFYALRCDNHSDSEGNGAQLTETFDLLLPSVGELIGGSLREHRESVLREQMIAHGISSDEYDWYLGLRRHGTTPHGGFGLGLDRLLMYILGTESVKDVVPLPRFTDSCKF